MNKIYVDMFYIKALYTDLFILCTDKEAGLCIPYPICRGTTGFGTSVNQYFSEGIEGDFYQLN